MINSIQNKAIQYNSQKLFHFLTFVILATFSWTCNQTSEDIPVGESSITKGKQVLGVLSQTTQTSHTDMEPCARKYFRLCKEIIRGTITEYLHRIYYQLVFHVLYTKDASFDPNQHQQPGHLEVRGKGTERKMTLDRSLQFGFENLIE